MFINNNNYSKKTIQDAIEHCRSCLPNEGCGVIVNDEFIPFENKATEKTNNFLITDPKFNQLYIDGKIQAVIHSHNEYPHASYLDQQQQIEFQLQFGIINFMRGGASHFMFWGPGVEKSPLMERPFFFGVYDCCQLAKDYTDRTFNTDVPLPLRDLSYYERGIPYFEDYIKDPDCPFYTINIRDIQPHDLIFYKFNECPIINHVAVVDEYGKVLHHFINQISTRTPPSYYQQYIVSAARYKRDWESKND